MTAPWIEPARAWLRMALQPYWNDPLLAFVREAQTVPLGGLGPLLSKASRFARSRPLEPSPEACCKASGIRPGWNPERLQVLEALRLLLLVEREDLASPEFGAAFLGLFPFADEGEARALYKALALIPDGERFAWQAGEGLRTNVTGIFEAVACDSPYPAQYLPEVAWRSLCVKALFVGAPLWRVYGLDQRLSPDLARVALDLVEERRSAGRPIPANLWLLLGTHGGERGIASLMAEWRALAPGQRGAVALALGRAGEADALQKLVGDPADQPFIERALAGQFDPFQWRALEA
ncbi:MAG: EboA domain-containing protein [Planctomycetes bacterium]|nr:EboA domain-containing protein [Planctomycetota bacterium]